MINIKKRIENKMHDGVWYKMFIMCYSEKYYSIKSFLTDDIPRITLHIKIRIFNTKKTI